MRALDVAYPRPLGMRMLEAPHHSTVMVGLAAMVRLLKSAHFSENKVGNQFGTNAGQCNLYCEFGKIGLRWHFQNSPPTK